jgi:hypothetical protein
MVDFPEGYGFAPNESKWLMQSQFVVSIGVYESRTRNPTLYRSKYRSTSNRGAPPYSFAPFGQVVRDDERLYGYLSAADYHDSIFTGTLQDICTAMCTVHRLTGVGTGVKT